MSGIPGTGLVALGWCSAQSGEFDSTNQPFVPDSLLQTSFLREKNFFHFLLSWYLIWHDKDVLVENLKMEGAV